MLFHFILQAFLVSIDDLIFLGGLVVIRTTIAFFLNKEIQEVHAELAQPDNTSKPNIETTD